MTNGGLTRCRCFQQGRGYCRDFHRDEDARLLIAKVDFGGSASVVANVVDAVRVDERFPTVDVLKPNQLHVSLLDCNVWVYLRVPFLSDSDLETSEMPPSFACAVQEVRT